MVRLNPEGSVDQHCVLAPSPATISDLVVATRDGKRVVTADNIEPFLEDLLVNLFGRIEGGSNKEERENECVAVVRVGFFPRKRVGGWVQVVLELLFGAGSLRQRHVQAVGSEWSGYHTGR